MTSRWLMPDEWPKVAHTELGPALALLNPALTRILVVEDGDEIVGCWALMPMMHAEGLWIAPAHRGKGAVLGRLWKALTGQARRMNLATVLTSSMSEDVTAILEARGAKPFPASYVLEMDPKPRASDRALGKRFHDQLHAQVPGPQHPDDDTHNAAVGRAIRIGVMEGDYEKAEQQYNNWAARHGYVPVAFLRQTDNGVVVDIQEAIVAVSIDGDVTVLEDRTVTTCP